MESLLGIDWRPNARELRKFGVAMIAGFGLIGAALYLAGAEKAAYACWLFGALAGGLGLTGAAVGLPLYWLWMGLAYAVGSVVGRLILAACYYGVLTPIALCRRLGGGDPLRLRRGASRDSYWSDLPPAPDAADREEAYQRQF